MYVYYANLHVLHGTIGIYMQRSVQTTSHSGEMHNTHTRSSNRGVARKFVRGFPPLVRMRIAKTTPTFFASVARFACAHA